MYMYTHELVYDFLLEEANESDRIFADEKKKTNLFYGSMDADAFFNCRKTHGFELQAFRNGVEMIQQFAEKLDADGKLNAESLWKKFSEIFTPMFFHKKCENGPTFVELYIQVG